MKRYLILALALHVGAIALAFTQYQIRRLQGSSQPRAMQSEVAVQRTEETVRQYPPAELSRMPKLETAQSFQVDAPGEVLLPPREPKSEPQPPARNQPAPEGTLAELPRKHSPALVIAPAKSADVTEELAGELEGESHVTDTGATGAEETKKINKRPAFGDVPGADEPPRLLNRNWPKLIREGYEGQVLVGVVVAPEGHAISVEILEGTGNARWDDRLKGLFRYSAYAPGRTAGRAVMCSHRFRITFRRK